MEQLRIPAGYHSPLTIRETEVAIKEVKDHFERALAKNLHLTRVSAPLFVRPESGLNDNLNGVERPVSFDIKEQDGSVAEIVHSLAKWKRYALKNYNFHSGEGLYTDMSAIRRDEDTDNIHSLYVDQWDWEKVISKEERNTETLQYTVRKVYQALKDTEEYISRRYNYIDPLLPDDISLHRSWKTFIRILLPKNVKKRLRRKKAQCLSPRLVAYLLPAKDMMVVLRTMMTGS